MRILILGLAVAVTANVGHAQQPNLTGTWAAMPGEVPGDLPTAPSPVLGARFGLSLDGNTVTLSRPGSDVSMRSVLTVGGAPTTTSVPGPLCMGERRFHETAAWESDRLVLTITGITPAGGGQPSAANSRFLLRLDTPDRLVVEATMVQQGQRRQVGSVYRRRTDSLPPPVPPLPITGTAATISQVAWIGTTWTGTTGATTTEERWTPPASGSMIAISRTLRGAALVAYESLCIVERGGTLVYFAMPNGRVPATPFVATEVTPTSVTFENPAHDYPQLIRYALTPVGDLETSTAGAAGARSQKVVLKKGGAAP